MSERIPDPPMHRQEPGVAQAVATYEAVGAGPRGGRLEAPVSVGCAAHKTHRPKLWAPLELHHVIPREWQAFYTPTPSTVSGTLPPPTTAVATVVLWDARTVALCRTGHGNVHYWIVRLMREVKAKRTEDPALASAALVGGRTEEQRIALLALTRMVEAGGSLVALADAGHLGGMFGSGG